MRESPSITDPTAVLISDTVTAIGMVISTITDVMAVSTVIIIRGNILGRIDIIAIDITAGIRGVILMDTIAATVTTVTTLAIIMAGVVYIAITRIRDTNDTIVINRYFYCRSIKADLCR